MKQIHSRLRPVALLLALFLFCLPLAACAKSGGQPLLTLNSDGTKVMFPVNHYQFLLSRLRGNFVQRGVSNSAGSASQAAFWDVQGYLGGDELKTWGTFYSEQVLENCKTYLVGLWLFEKNNLSLSESARSEIEQKMEDVLTYHADGSKTKLNSVLQNYGVNYDLLKSFYETEAKLAEVLKFLYGENASLLDATVKDPYLNANYYRYQRIAFPFYEESYTLDDDGNRIYETDENGNTALRAMTEEERAAVVEKANALFADLQGKTEAEFEAAMLEENGSSEYTDGYYIPRSASADSGSDVLAILEKLGELEEGEIALLTFSDGIQIIRRYAPTPGAYNLEVNAVWFSSFSANLTAELFVETGKSYFSEIELDEAAFAASPKIKEIEPNYYF